MKQNLLTKVSSGSVTGSLVFTNATLVDTSYTIVTLPTTPGFMYDVYINGNARFTAAGTGGQFQTNCFGRHSTNLAPNTGITGNSNSLFTGSATQLTNLTSTTEDFILKQIPPGTAIAFSSLTYCTTAPTGTYHVNYVYVGRKITEGNF